MSNRYKRLGAAICVWLLGIAVSVIGDDQLVLTDEQVRENVASFDTVWTTVYEEHFDTTFDDVDWQALRDSLRPQVASATTMREARAVMRRMLDTLGVSHVGIIPASLYLNIDKPETPPDPETEIEDREFGGVSGISVRVLNGRAVVTAVYAGSPAGVAGVEVGWEIYIVDGDTIPGLLPEIEQEMAGSPALPRYLASVAGTRLRGYVGDTVTVVFRDGDETEVSKKLVLDEPTGKKAVFGNLPPMYLRTETDTLENGIGYFAFNCFFDPGSLMPSYNAAMRSSLDAPGLIIDLRGNPGGIAGMAMGMAGWLVKEKNLYIGTLSTRDTQLRMVLNPRARTFDGPLAILIDGLSGSTAEFFAGGLQDIGRACIFGTNSMGAALPSLVKRLPNGDRFQYVLGNYVLGSGAPLEGRGVVPDEEVHLAREALLAGDDPVLDAATDWIHERNETEAE